MIRAENVMYNRGYKRDTKGSGKPKKKPDINECAEKKLARKEMSAKELRDYLTKKEYDSQEIDTVISTLLEFGYLNDARFATEYLIYDLGRGRSLKKALYDLRQKGAGRSREGFDRGRPGERLDTRGYEREDQRPHRPPSVHPRILSVSDLRHPTRDIKVPRLPIDRFDTIYVGTWHMADCNRPYVNV